MTIVNPLNTGVTIKLDGVGHGVAQLGPNRGDFLWRITRAAVYVPNAILIPQCRVYVGPSPTDQFFIDGTYTGNLNSTDSVDGFPLSNGMYVWAVWDGGDPLASAILSLLGSSEMAKL